MYNKFIINQFGHLRFGNVYLHRELLHVGEQCVFGGGLWRLDDAQDTVFLYGRSFDFGLPDFEFLKKVEWDSLDGKTHKLVHLPHWPNEETAVPITF